MKIALLGYGKMGKTIERIAIERSHEIVLRQEASPLDTSSLSKADVAIDFSVPEAAFHHLTSCFELGIPVVCGTTGWLSKYDEAVRVANEKFAKFMYASNFSLGVHLFFQLNEQLAKLMNAFKDYHIQLEEIHHTEKLDAPSGTAISLAEGILKNNKQYTAWKYPPHLAEAHQLPIEAKRIADVKGTHIVTYASNIDELEIKHTAHTRDGFALGAVIASEWLTKQPNPGIYSMKDVLHAFSSTL